LAMSSVFTHFVIGNMMSPLPPFPRRRSRGPPLRG
jgi:hypothetical protein